MSHDHRAICLCVAEHRPAYLELEWHHIWPVGMGGDDTPIGVLHENGVWLCPTAHTNAHEILRLMVKYGPLTYGEVDSRQERPVSRYAYAVARQGYDAWVAGSPHEATYA